MDAILNRRLYQTKAVSGQYMTGNAGNVTKLTVKAVLSGDGYLRLLTLPIPNGRIMSLIHD